MLSHHEDRQLRAIEQWFEESDPALTRMLRNYEAPVRSPFGRITRIAIDILGGLLFILGAVLTVPVLVVVGFLLVVIGVCLHLAAHGPHGSRGR
jgi:fatty acid desaturase